MSSPSSVTSISLDSKANLTLLETFPKISKLSPSELPTTALHQQDKDASNTNNNSSKNGGSNEISPVNDGLSDPYSFGRSNLEQRLCDCIDAISTLKEENQTLKLNILELNNRIIKQEQAHNTPNESENRALSTAHQKLEDNQTVLITMKDSLEGCKFTIQTPCCREEEFPQEKRTKLIFDIDKNIEIIVNILKERKPELGDFDLALLSAHSYEEILTGDRLITFKKKTNMKIFEKYLKNWTIMKLLISNEKNIEAVIYTNPSLRKYVLAYRGTNFSFQNILKSLFTLNKNTSIETDIYGVLLDQATYHEKEAKQMAEETLKMLNKDLKNPNKNESYQLILTGHSLGGWLAVIGALYIKKKDKSISTQVVTFDDPGSEEIILKNKPSIEQFHSQFVLDIVTYLSFPNIVNCCGKRIVRKCFFIKTELPNTPDECIPQLTSQTTTSKETIFHKFKIKLNKKIKQFGSYFKNIIICRALQTIETLGIEIIALNLILNLLQSYFKNMVICRAFQTIKTHDIENIALAMNPDTGFPENGVCKAVYDWPNIKTNFKINWLMRKLPNWTPIGFALGVIYRIQLFKLIDLINDKVFKEFVRNQQIGSGGLDSTDAIPKECYESASLVRAHLIIEHNLDLRPI